MLFIIMTMIMITCLKMMMITITWLEVMMFMIETIETWLEVRWTGVRQPVEERPGDGCHEKDFSHLGFLQRQLSCLCQGPAQLLV